MIQNKNNSTKSHVCALIELNISKVKLESSDANILICSLGEIIFIRNPKILESCTPKSCLSSTLLEIAEYADSQVAINLQLSSFCTRT